MKIYFEKNITAISGKDLAENVIYSSIREGNLCYARKYVYPTLTANNDTFGANGNNIKALWNSATPAYKADLRTYSQRENQGKYWETKKSNYAWFCKIVYAYCHSEGLSPSVVDIAALRSSNAKSVSSAIQNQFIPDIAEKNDLLSTI